MLKRCDVCNIELPEHDYEGHISGKKHLKKTETENVKKALVEKSIVVEQMPPGLSMSDIVNFFSEFGKIERCKLESNFAIIDFKEKHPVNFLLSKPIWMGRHKLEIKWRQLVENSSPKQIKSPDEAKTPAEINFVALKEKLEKQTTFEGELATFMNEIGLNSEEVESNWKSLHSILLETFQPRFPNCKIFRFGSSVTGLCFKGSDFDIYLDIGQPIYEEEEKKLGWTPRKLFKQVKSLMYQKKPFLERIILIPRARTPIIKFCHAATSTNCDLSFKNDLGVINSDLIKKLISLDVRIKPVMMIIKFWAKTFELSGCGRITNYAIVMLIIFYLQQPETKLLPPISELQKNCEPVYRWNCQVNFNRNAVFPPSSNTNTITQLVHGFFKFYLTFDFQENLISPLDGCSHLRSELLKNCAEKGEDADPLSLKKPICVQDPIELENNITVGVSPKTLKTFQRFCNVGVEVSKVSLQNNNEAFLLNLFTTLPVAQKELNLPQVVILAANTLQVGLPKDFNTRTDVKDKNKFMEDNWYAIVQRLTEEIFKRVFRLEVQKIKNGHETKQQKVAGSSDVHSNDNDNIILECIGNHDVMVGRKSGSFCLDPTLSPIDKEALITDEVVKKQKGTGAKIDFTCTIVRAKNPVRLILRLTLRLCDRNSTKKHRRRYTSFISTELSALIHKELIHMLQYNKS